MAEPEVLAAGGLLVRDDGRVAVVHRPRYDDWSLPKGKLDPVGVHDDARVARPRGAAHPVVPAVE